MGEEGKGVLALLDEKNKNIHPTALLSLQKMKGKLEVGGNLFQGY